MKNNYLLALLSAILMWLAWPPITYAAPLLWFAFIPLLIAVERILRDDRQKKGKRVFLVAGMAMLLWNTASIYWVFNSISQVMPVYAAIPISLIPFGLGALLMTLTFRIYASLRKRLSIYWSLIGWAGFWICYEYLHQSWDLAFPWMTLGNGFAASHQLIQWYEVTGAYGGSVWVLGANIFAFLAVLSIRDGFSRFHTIRMGLFLTAWILIPVTASLIRYVQYTERVNPAQVVVVQPNIEPYGKFGDISPEEQVEILIRLSESVAPINTEFFIWPETAIAHRFGYEEETFRNHPIFHKLQAFLNPYKNASIVSGIESYTTYQEPLTFTAREWEGVYYDHFNAVVMIENSPELQFYHKSKLVPGVEQLPFGDALSFMKPLFSAFGGTTGGYGRQDEASVLYTQSGIGAAPVVCYESIWGSYVGDYVRKGAQFVTIVTNDGWWGNTSGKDQHFDYAKLRAIETRRWVARSANTGISGFIDQRGDVKQRTEWWVEDARHQEINLNEALTLYVQYGDFVAYFMIMLAGGAGVAYLLKRRKPKK